MWADRTEKHKQKREGAVAAIKQAIAKQVMQLLSRAGHVMTTKNRLHGPTMGGMIENHVPTLPSGFHIARVC